MNGGDSYIHIWRGHHTYIRVIIYIWVTSYTRGPSYMSGSSYIDEGGYLLMRVVISKWSCFSHNRHPVTKLRVKK